MNNTFNFNRFNKVVAYDWKRYLRNFGITLLVWISLPIMFWVTTLIFDFELPVEARESIIFALVAIALMLAPSRIYGKANLSRDGVGFAMMPATSLEKFFSMILYCSLVTPAVTLVGSWLVDCLLTLLPFGGFKEFAMYEDLLKNISFGDFMMFVAAMATAAWAESSIFMFGNMIFKRRKTGKTFAWGLLIVFSLTMLMQLFHLLDAFGTWVVDTSAQLEKRFLPWLYSVFQLVIAIVFYVLTYRKIKTQKY